MKAEEWGRVDVFARVRALEKESMCSQTQAGTHIRHTYKAYI